MIPGAPDLNFENAMKLEHCLKKGSGHEFTTDNYQITTCARNEWKIIVESEVDLADMHNSRKIPSIEDLYNSVLAREAGLRRVEVIAIVLYTGPMVYILNF